MQSAQAELAELLGPPQPDIVPVPWERAPAEVGFQFPADYRWLIDTYGQIGINGELHVSGPGLRPSAPGTPGGFEGFLHHTTSHENPSASFHRLHLQGDYREAPFPFLPTVCARRHPDWQSLIGAPLGDVNGTRYTFSGDWTGWGRKKT
jgi:hypothetical protein